MSRLGLPYGLGRVGVTTRSRGPHRVDHLVFVGSISCRGIWAELYLQTASYVISFSMSAVLETKLQGGVAAVVLVHAFGPVCHANLADYSSFLLELGGRSTTIGVVSDPILLGENQDLPTYFLWCQQAASGEREMTDLSRNDTI